MKLGRERKFAKSSGTRILLKSNLWPFGVFDDILLPPFLQIIMIWEFFKVQNIKLMTRGSDVHFKNESGQQYLATKLSIETEQQNWVTKLTTKLSIEIVQQSWATISSIEIEHRDSATKLSNKIKQQNRATISSIEIEHRARATKMAAVDSS